MATNVKWMQALTPMPFETIWWRNTVQWAIPCIPTKIDITAHKLRHHVVFNVSSIVSSDPVLILYGIHWRKDASFRFLANTSRIWRIMSPTSWSCEQLGFVHESVSLCVAIETQVSREKTFVQNFLVQLMLKLAFFYTSEDTSIQVRRHINCEPGWSINASLMLNPDKLPDGSTSSVIKSWSKYLMCKLLLKGTLNSFIP